MRRSLIWAEAARRDLRNLDKAAAARVVEAIERLAGEEQGDIKKLYGSPEEWRLRVGDWRVRFTFDEHAKAIQVIRILHRREAYRRR